MGVSWSEVCSLYDQAMIIMFIHLAAGVCEAPYTLGPVPLPGRQVLLPGSLPSWRWLGGGLFVRNQN